MRHVVITGSTGGIGHGLAKELLAQGCTHRMADRAQDHVAILDRAPGQARDIRRICGAIKWKAGV
jgi:NAD(P)-dependent dehydrogenase (short-subunit alcohol dehydrogenase family)